MTKPHRWLSKYAKHHPLVGPLLFVAALQYFIAQAVVAAAWTTQFSLKNNYISNLGNTECGQYAGLYVCSPLYPLMNLSFIVFGITISLGTLLIYRQFARTKLANVGFSMLFLSGIGSMIVGLFPENTVGSLHVLGAFFGLVVGNMGIGLLGAALKNVHTSVRIYSVLTAAVTLVAFVLFYSGIYLGIGLGGMERVVSYGYTLWMVVFGLYLIVRANRGNKA